MLIAERPIRVAMAAASLAACGAWAQDDSDLQKKLSSPIADIVTLRVRPVGFVPMNFVVGAGYNVIRPDNASDWFVRLQINFVLPK